MRYKYYFPIPINTKMHLRNTFIIALALSTIFVVLSQPAAAQSCILSVTSIPDEGAISIDGQQRGETPLGISLPCGNHSVEVVKTGYEPYHDLVYLQPDKQNNVVANLEYSAGRGSVLIRSQPPGGTLFVDGIFRGATPIQIDNLVYGRHTVLIEKPGYQKFRDVVSAGPAGIPDYMEYLVPEPQTGFVGVVSSPEGADVYLDGLVMGVTPTRLERTSAGNHSILIQKQGYENYTSDVVVAGGESVLVRADLSTILNYGTLVIDSIPQAADIYLNGTLKGVTPAVFINIPPGGYTLEFRKRTYPHLNSSFTLNGGETREVFANLTNGTAGSADITGSVYLKRSNASQLLPGLVDTTPSYEKTYTWYNNGHEATVRIRIPQDLYDHYNKSAPHNRGPANLSRYAISEEDRIYLHDLIGILKDAGESKTFTARNDYRNVVAFVQALNYTEDLDPLTKQKTDYWQYPVETLADGKGDCEDHAILAAALLKEMGYDVALVLLEDPTKGHAAVALACDNCNGYYYTIDGRRYYFLETTAYGSSLGIMDPYYEKIGADVIVLQDREHGH